MAGEGFTVPITYEIFNAGAVDTAIGKFERLEKAAEKVGLATYASVDALDKYNRKLEKIARKAEAEARKQAQQQQPQPPAKTYNSWQEAKEAGYFGKYNKKQDTVSSTNQFYAEVQRNESIIKQAKEFQKLAADAGLGDAFQHLVKVRTEVRAMLGDYKELVKLNFQYVDALAKQSAYRAPGMATKLRDTKEIQTYIALTDKLIAAEAKLSDRNLNMAKSAMLKESEVKQRLAGLREEISLKEKLAKVQAVDTLNKSTDYQRDTQKLRELTRAQYERLAVEKLVDKVAKDRAAVAAYSSEQYLNEVASLKKLTSEQRVAAETAKALEQAEMRLAKAKAQNNPLVQQLAKEYNDLTHKMVRAERAAKGFSDTLTGTNQITAGFRAALYGIGMGFGIYTSGTILAATATYGFVSAFREVIAGGSELEHEMARVSAAMGHTEKQSADLSERALDLSTNSRYSANEVVKAYREMAMSGFTYQETVNGINAVLKMASIGMMDFGQAADIATNILFGFNLEATDLEHVVDVLATTITRSSQDLEQLGTAMSYIAPIASSFGLSLETVAAATEVLASAGIKSSRAGTGLRRTLTALFSDSENVSEALSKLGVRVNTTAFDMDKEFIRILKELNKATNNATSGVGELKDAVGLYAVPAFLNLVKAAHEGVGSLDEIMEAYDQVGGAATTMQERMEESLKVDWEEMQAALSAIKTELYSIFGPDLREMLQKFTGWLRAIAENKDAIRELVDTFKDLIKTVALLAGGLALGTAIQAFGKLAMKIMEVAAGYKALRTASTGASVATTATTGAGAAAAAASTRGHLGELIVPLSTTRAATTAGVAAAAKPAAEGLSKMALASKALSAAMTGTVITAGLMILWDIGKAIYDLNKITPKQVDNVNKLADAQERLNSALRGYKISDLNAGLAQDTATNKRALDEAETQLNKIKEDLFAVAEERNRFAMSHPQSSILESLIRREEELTAEYAKAQEDKDTVSAKYYTSLGDFAEKEIESLKKRIVELTVDKAEVGRQLEPVQANYDANYKSIVAQAYRDYQNSWIWTTWGTFDEYLESVSPSAAKASKELLDLKNKALGIDSALTITNTTLQQSILKLDGVKKAARDAQGIQIDKQEIADYVGGGETLLKNIDNSRNKIQEKTRLENNTLAEQLDFYNQIIAAYEEKEALVRSMQPELEKNLTAMTTLEAKVERGDKLEPEDEARLKELQAWQKKYEDAKNFLKNEPKSQSEYAVPFAAALEKRIELRLKEIDATLKLKELLLELNAPMKASFVDTFMGDTDYALANADALLNKIRELNAAHSAYEAARAKIFGKAAIDLTPIENAVNGEDLLRKRDEERQKPLTVDYLSEQMAAARRQEADLLAQAEEQKRLYDVLYAGTNEGRDTDDKQKEALRRYKETEGQLLDAANGRHDVQRKITDELVKQGAAAKSNYTYSDDELKEFAAKYDTVKIALEAYRTSLNEIEQAENKKLFADDAPVRARQQAISQVSEAIRSAVDDTYSLREAFLDLAKTPLAFNFPETLKGSADYALKNADVLIAKIGLLNKKHAEFNKRLIESLKNEKNPLNVTGIALSGTYSINDVDFASREAQRKAAESALVTPTDFAEATDKELELRRLAYQQQDIFNAASKAFNDRIAKGEFLTDAQKQQLGELRTSVEQANAAVREQVALREQIGDELTKAGKGGQIEYTYDRKQLDKLADSYNSVYARARLYGKQLKDISEAEKDGKLTAKEASALRIQAFDQLAQSAAAAVKIVRDVEESLSDLLNTPPEGDFAKTMKGSLDYTLKSADALIIKLEETRKTQKAIATETANTLRAQGEVIDAARVAMADAAIENAPAPDVAKLEAARKAQQDLTLAKSDFIAAQNKELELRTKAYQIDAQIEALTDQIKRGGANQYQIDQLETLKQQKEAILGLTDQIHEKEGDIYEELVKQGRAQEVIYEFSEERLMAKSDSFNSAYTRARNYRALMDDIALLESKGRLSKYEADNERIKAMNELRSATEETLKATLDLKAAIVDLFTTPFEGDFPDSLKGMADYMLAQSEALLAKVKQMDEARREIGAANQAQDLELGRARSYSSGSSVNDYDVLSTIRARNLTDELEIIKEVEKHYGLLENQLLTTWQVESSMSTDVGYRKLQGKKPTWINGPFQVSDALLAAGRKSGLDTSTFEGQAIVAGRYYREAMDAGYSNPAQQFMYYHGGPNRNNWGEDTLKHASKSMAVLEELNPGLKAAAQSTNAVAEANANWGTQLEKVATASQSLPIGDGFVQQANAMVEASNQTAESNDKIVASIMAQREAYAAMSVEQSDFYAAQQEEARLRLEAYNQQQQLEELKAQTNNGKDATEQQVQKMKQMEENRRSLVAQANQQYEIEGQIYEELVKQNKAQGINYEYQIKKLEGLAEGYDSAWSRSRKYYKTMDDIYKLEKAGYLKPTEAYLEKINAELGAMDPLTRQFSEEIVNTLTNVWTGTEDASEAIDNLKKSLKNLTMEKFVVNLGVSMVGNIMEPFVKVFEQMLTSYLTIGANIFSTIGSMLLNSVGGMLGMATTSSGTGLGSTGGISNLFSMGGLTNLFGGYSIGTDLGSMLLGSPVAVTEAIAYQGTGLNSAFSEGVANIASTSNWMLMGSSLAGSLLGNALFGDTGYGGIGSSLGSTAGALIGQALIPIPGVGALIGSLLGGTGGGFLGSLFGEEEAKVGPYAYTTTGSPLGLEDQEVGEEIAYSKGGFGLNFGITDTGSQGMEAKEMKDAFDGLAEITKTLESFFGDELSSKISASLAAMGDLVSLSTYLPTALSQTVYQIGNAAAATGDELGLAFSIALRELEGDAEEIALQVEAAMAVAPLFMVAANDAASEIGQLLDMTDDYEHNVRQLSNYVDEFKESSEDTATAFVRLLGQLDALSIAATQTGTVIDSIDTWGLMTLSDELVEAFGSLDALSAAMTTYYTEFTDANEQTADLVRTASKVLKNSLPGLWDLIYLPTLPQSRDAFTDLIDGIDLTTEAGRDLYAALLVLADEFDLLFDGSEAFSDWLLGVDDVERATARLTDLFAELGMVMPDDRDALLELYNSGALTTEQMALLASYLEDLSTVFGDLADPAEELAASLERIQASLERYRDTETATLGDLDRAMAELTAWNTWGMLPDADELDRVLSVLDAIDPQAFATQQAYDIAQGKIYSNLTALEERALADNAEVTTADTLDAYLAADRTAAATEASAAQNEAQVIMLSEVRASIEALRHDLAITSSAQTVPLRAIENRLIQWEADGLPETRAA